MMKNENLTGTTATPTQSQDITQVSAAQEYLSAYRIHIRRCAFMCASVGFSSLTYLRSIYFSTIYGPRGPTMRVRPAAMYEMFHSLLTNIRKHVVTGLRYLSGRWVRAPSGTWGCAHPRSADCCTEGDWGRRRISINPQWGGGYYVYSKSSTNVPAIPYGITRQHCEHTFCTLAHTLYCTQ